jgi:hypothetical protein
MAATITFFPVDCGDMTLVVLGDRRGTTILIDCKIREAADDPEDTTRDVAQDLRSRIKRDAKGRPYVDAFLLSHPDKDHCSGIEKHFHLSSPTDYADDKKPDSEKKILINEIWSSPLVFRRASKDHKLCDEAKAFNAEAKRRVKVNRDAKFVGVEDGNRILVLGEDEDGKTDDLGPILVKIDQSFSAVNGSASKVFKGSLLAPFSKSENEEEEETLSKNESSVIMNIELADSESRKCVKNFLTGGDAEVAIWERLWDKHKESPKPLEYDLLQTPHHCSWHSLSHDSWCETKGKGEVSKSARSALSQIRCNGSIVASSAAIKDDYNDPPCIGAKREYVDIVDDAEGKFYCTGEYPEESKPAPLEFSLTEAGLTESVRKAVAKSLTRAAVAAGGLTFPDKPVSPNKPAGFA